MALTVRLNGQDTALDADPEMPLLWALRDIQGLAGTKFGCGAGLCGACTVLVDGVPTRSCITALQDVAGAAITTIEAIGQSEIGRRVQAAWRDLDVVQCGYCQSGQIVAATALLTANPDPTDAEIDEAMTGNICRCGTYPRIRAAIHAVARR